MGVDNSMLYAPVLIVPNPEDETDPVAYQLSLGWTCLGRSCPADYKNKFTGQDVDPKKVFTNVLFSSRASSKTRIPKSKPN
jgi:hypothetical protein